MRVLLIHKIVMKPKNQKQPHNVIVLIMSGQIVFIQKNQSLVMMQIRRIMPNANATQTLANGKIARIYAMRTTLNLLTAPTPPQIAYVTIQQVNGWNVKKLVQNFQPIRQIVNVMK